MKINKHQFYIAMSKQKVWANTNTLQKINYKQVQNMIATSLNCFACVNNIIFWWINTWNSVGKTIEMWTSRHLPFIITAAFFVSTKKNEHLSLPPSSLSLILTSPIWCIQEHIVWSTFLKGESCQKNKSTIT